MPDTIPPPAGSIHPPAPTPTGSHSVVPPSMEDHPIMRASKWVGAILGIGAGITAAVTGIWHIGLLIDDLNDTRAELASLHSSFSDYQDETLRRNEIQAEILNNLRIAVASIQAVAEFRANSHPAPRAPRPPRPAAASHSTSAVRDPSPVGVGTEPFIGAESLSMPLDEFSDRSPEVADLMRSLPSLPSEPPPTISLPGASPTEVDIAHESATADIALERVEILQDAL